VLVDQEGLDYAATAELLGVPAGTVASRLATARAKLRRQLALALGREG
jgi:DNA-directed RNA polymerase specialized sigma24 family protein